MQYFLQFSDAAKFADIARNLFDGLEYGNKFSFWNKSIFHTAMLPVFPAPWTLPIMPFSIMAFFRMFGVNDFSVMATSIFYFLLTLIFVFLLSRKIFKSNFIAFLSVLAVGFNNDLINYAKNGASEVSLMFEVVAATYFLTVKKKWTTALGFLLLVASYFTRPQAFIYIAGIVFYYILTRFKLKNAIFCFLIVLAIGLSVDRFVLPPYSGINFLYSVTVRGTGELNQYSSGVAVSDALRGAPLVSIQPTASATISSHLLNLFKKVFYNLYNFYRLMPQIMNPYLFFLFAVGIFRRGKNEFEKPFKIASVFMIALTFLVTAASIPFFRYIHPIVPFVYLIAVDTLVFVVSKISSFEFLISKQIPIPKIQMTKKGLEFRISSFGFDKNKAVALVSVVLVFIFVIGQTLGIIFLDSRFERKTHNVGKPPVYVEMSKVLKIDTDKNDVIVTNLDTWGSWYGERKTVWFPLEPSQLNLGDGKKHFDAIYLTNYLMDDENYKMGEAWKQIFENPTNIKDEYVRNNYELSKEYVFPASENYEKMEGRGVLLVRRKNTDL